MSHRQKCQIRFYRMEFFKSSFIIPYKSNVQYIVSYICHHGKVEVRLNFIIVGNWNNYVESKV